MGSGAFNAVDENLGACDGPMDKNDQSRHRLKPLPSTNVRYKKAFVSRAEIRPIGYLEPKLATVTNYTLKISVSRT